MSKRANKQYVVIYIGDDSHSHRKVVLAADHNEAVEKVEAMGFDIIVGVRKCRLRRPFGMAFLLTLVIVAVVLIAVSLHNRIH